MTELEWREGYFKYEDCSSQGGAGEEFQGRHIDVYIIKKKALECVFH